MRINHESSHQCVETKDSCPGLALLHDIEATFIAKFTADDIKRNLHNQGVLLEMRIYVFVWPN
jgi:hypothetical protein